jgi:hypothetical protein
MEELSRISIKSDVVRGAQMMGLLPNYPEEGRDDFEYDQVRELAPNSSRKKKSTESFRASSNHFVNNTRVHIKQTTVVDAEKDELTLLKVENAMLKQKLKVASFFLFMVFLILVTGL